MRSAVLDVGSCAVNLLIADAGAPGTARRWKVRTRLADRMAPDGRITADGRARVVAAVRKAVRELRRSGVGEVFAYATAAIRDAPNGGALLDEVAEATGMRLGTLTGVEEARLTFLAASRWLDEAANLRLGEAANLRLGEAAALNPGEQAGRMLLLDIGGGTLELARGRRGLPDEAISVPLGAGRLTREFLAAGDPPPAAAVWELRQHVRAQVRTFAAYRATGQPLTVVAASTTFRQLARLGEARRHRELTVDRRTLRPWADRLARMPAAKRAGLPGVSETRARQLLAGAIVGHELMRGLGVTRARVCPWGLREGAVLLRREQPGATFGGASWTPLGAYTPKVL